jgi:hypothetical protein
MSDESDPRSASESPAEDKPLRDEKGRFLPGQTGNRGGLPGGRPRGTGFMTVLDRELEAQAANGKSRMENLVAKLLAMAEAGDTRAMDLVLRRIAPERLSIESDGLPLVLLRNFAGVEPEAPRLPEGPATAGPVVEVVEEDELPEGAEQLPDGTVRWRLSS